uniref:Ig-like domain-containing protein n=2 Tax=Strigops habroptila TaxID=2489341 RepID=A0A672UKH7_STRHB
MAGPAAAAPLPPGQLGLVPPRLSGAGAQAGQSFELHQPQVKVSVAAGETLTLTCTASGDGPVGPVKWLKGWGSENETIYDQTGTFPRVTRAVTESNTDFTIHIRDVRPEDAGTYYCVKFEKLLGSTKVFQSGNGTEVSLHEAALAPSMVALSAVLCFLLLGFIIALCMYRRKCRGEAESRDPAGPVAGGSFLPIPLRCCAGTPGTSSQTLDPEASHLPKEQSSKEDNNIHYADLQPLPAAPRHSRSPGTASSEYASIRVTAK